MLSGLSGVRGASHWQSAAGKGTKMAEIDVDLFAT
jgi:hypothetical protein